MQQSSENNQPTGRIDMTAHERTVCIGDVHGDLWPFLEVMQHAKLIQVSPSVMDAATVCHTRVSMKKRTGYPITKEEANSIAWIGGSSCAVFTGDILDNRRSHKQDMYGVCSMSGTQQMILYLLGELNRKARRNGGRVVLVLGNHDVANMIYDPSNGMCRNYAPQFSFDEEQNANYATCAPSGEFSQKHVKKMKRNMVHLRAVAVLRIVGSNDDSVIVVHGGLCGIPTLSSASFPPRYRIEKNVPAQENVMRINRLFWDAAHNDSTANNLIIAHTEKLPIWCRPKKIDNSKDLIAYFNCDKIIKAHDVQSNANCNVHGSAQSNGKKRMQSGELCRIDVAMGRAFEHHRSGFFAYCELTNHDDGIHRQIVEWKPHQR